MNCALAGAQTQHGRPLNRIVRPHHMSQPHYLEAILALAQFWAAPTIMFAISIAYFQTDQKLPVSRRILGSAHGAVGAAVFLGAIVVHWMGAARRAFDVPYLVLIAFSAALIVASFFLFRGPRAMHLLQLVNVPCLAWTLVVGEMAVTGEWL
jgi:hypothetical protein